MNIKVNDKILSIPPYISTKWSQIASLSVKGNFLEISLVNGTLISIPELKPDIIELIFNQHAAHVEKGNSSFIPQNSLMKNEQLSKLFSETEGPSVRFGFSSMDEFGNIGQHNPAQADAPNLPQQILEKIAAISKILSTEELALPQAAPSCNCFYCQIARVINPTTQEIHATPIQEQAITEEDLHFRQWNIASIGKNLYSVTNCIDETEKYNVFLGEPIGCTCGNQGCEHIIAVLKT